MEQSVINKVRVSFDAYFFSRANLVSVGILRIILVLYFMLQFAGKNLTPFRDSLLTTLHERSALTTLLGDILLFPGAPIIFSVAGICALIGLATRPALFIFGLYTIALTGISASMGVFDHLWSLVSQVVVILAFIPGSTNLSADRALSRILKMRRGVKLSLSEIFKSPPEQVWGMRLLLIILACVYFTAGVSKLRYGGFEWVDGKTLTHYLDGSASTKNGIKPPIYLSSSEVSAEEKWKDGFGLYGYSYGNRVSSIPARNAGEFIAAHPRLIMFLAMLTVIFELSAFLLLFDKLPRTLYLFGAIILHTSIGFLMNLDFMPYRMICFLLIDWNWVVGGLGALKSRRRKD
ncbi:MAG TPA: hypothetical protein VGE26_11250, partial [Sphingobacteriaceae bacterium]